MNKDLSTLPQADLGLADGATYQASPTRRRCEGNLLERRVGEAEVRDGLAEALHPAFVFIVWQIAVDAAPQGHDRPLTRKMPTTA